MFNLGTDVLAFRSAGNDLAMLNAATAFAIANNQWPLRLPPGLYNLGGSGTWYVNANQSNTGGPVDSIDIIGSSVGTPTSGTSGVQITGGTVWIGCGSGYSNGGNQPDANTPFISRNTRVSNLQIAGALELWCLQDSGLIQNVQINATGVNGTTRGLHGAFCNTLTFLDVRCDNYSTTLDGWALDTCQDTVIIGGAANTGSVGFQCVQEIVYSSNPDGSPGSERMTLHMLGFHIEQNYEEGAIFANISGGHAQIRAITDLGKDWTAPIVRIGHPSNPAYSTENFAVSGYIDGVSGPPSGSIAIELDYATTATIMSDTRIENVQTGINVTSNCSNPQICPGVAFDSSVTTPVVTPSNTFSFPISAYGGTICFPANAGGNVPAIAELRADGQSGQILLWRFSADSVAPYFQSSKARGTPSGLATVQTHDVLLDIFCYGYGATGFQEAGTIKITTIAATPSDSDMQGQARIDLAPSGSVTPSNLLALDWTNGLALASGLSITVGGSNVIDQRSTFSNANYTMAAGDRIIAQTGTLSAQRTVTLLGAATFNAGRKLKIIDESGTASPLNYIAVAPNGTDKIQGLNSTQAAICTAYGWIELECDGSANWWVTGRSVDVQVFSGHGTYTWNRPLGVIRVEVEICGAGGGGGAGTTGASSISGGGGGGGGSCGVDTFAAADAGASQTVTIGQGGAGGASTGANGNAGNSSTFSSLSTGYGGGYGSGGSPTASAGGGAAGIYSVGGNASGATAGSAGTGNGGAGGSGTSGIAGTGWAGSGGGGTATTGVAGTGAPASFGGPGGAAGGGLSLTPASNNGGGGRQSRGNNSAAAGGNSGTPNGGGGSSNYPYMAGNSGAGGYGNASGNGGNGGNGGSGSGGGGGGSCLTSITPGTGGSGGDGYAVVRSS